jgi:hypothetical protein
MEGGVTDLHRSRRLTTDARPGRDRDARRSPGQGWRPGRLPARCGQYPRLSALPPALHRPASREEGDRRNGRCPGGGHQIRECQFGAHAMKEI